MLYHAKKHVLHDGFHYAHESNIRLFKAGVFISDYRQLYKNRNSIIEVFVRAHRRARAHTHTHTYARTHARARADQHAGTRVTHTH